MSWKHRMDTKREDPDALYSAMFDLYRIGEEAFATEYQNKPMKQGVSVYTLTPEVIMSRATDRVAGAVPEWVRLRVAATDINPSFGMTWSLVGFGMDQTAAVLGYGVHKMHVPTGSTTAEAEARIYENLVQHGRNLAALPCRPEVWIIDAGGAQFDVAIRFAMESARLCGVQAIPSTGRGARNYRPFGKSVLGRPREYCHMAVDARGRKWVAWNTDYWREQAQKAWTGSIGAPGSCSLPAGHHREFAEQICREILRGKDEIGGQMVWVWDTAPGNHDYGDCMGMAFMGAAWGGIGTGGRQPAPAKRKRQRAQVSRVSI